MPESPEVNITLSADADVRPGNVIVLSDGTGQRYVGQIVNVERSTTATIASARAVSVPTTWIRTGQTAYCLTNPSERIVIVGVTESVHCRQWVERNGQAELGNRMSANFETFGEIWYPYYHSQMTRPGARFYNVATQRVYEVFSQSVDTFTVRDDRGGEYILARGTTSPAVWLYMEAPAEDPRQPTSFAPISFTRKAPLEAPPPPPKTRFDRDDIL